MRRTALAVAVSLASSAVPVFAATHDVSVGGAAGLAFSPANLTITAGDTVRFTNAGGFHNVLSDAGAVTSFRCANGCDGDGGNGNANSTAWVAEVTFPTVGSAPYHCEIHEGSGMVGTITVEAASTPTVQVTPTSVSGSADAGGSANTGFELANTGGATLDWTLDTSVGDCVSPADVPWITLAPTSGSIASGGTAASIGITLDATSLTPGAYNANICVHSNDVANDPLTLPVSFTVNTPDLIFENGFDG